MLDQPKGQGMVVSCYADTSVSEGFASHWLQPFKTEAGRIRQLLADDHRTRRLRTTFGCSSLQLSRAVSRPTVPRQRLFIDYNRPDIQLSGPEGKSRSPADLLCSVHDQPQEHEEREDHQRVEDNGGDLAAGQKGPEDVPQLVPRLHRKPGPEER